MASTAELIAALPPEVAEVAGPALAVRCSGGRMVVTLCHPIWIEAAERHIAPVARVLAQQEGLELVITARRGGDSLASAPGFDAVLEDPGNRLALAACRRVAAAPGSEHNPLVLHGPAGSGKTLLLAAVCAELRSVSGPGAVVQLDGDMLVARAGAITSGTLAGLDAEVALAIDGLDAIAGRALAQEALFQLINRCLDRGAQVLVTARQPPARLALEERLASRLAWGLVVGIDAPSPELRTALLRRLAGSAVTRLDPVAVAALVDRHAPDAHHVVDLAQRLLAGEQPDAGAVGFDAILAAVAERCGVRPSDLTGPGRQRELVRARQLALLLARRHTEHSLTALGNMVGGRDHATVLHAVREAEQRCQHDLDWKRLVDEVAARVIG